MSSACPHCARRGWLLETLSNPLDFRARDPSRFWSALELPDRALIDALAGKRRVELHRAYTRWQPTSGESGESLKTICRHRRTYPASLRGDALAPHMFGMRGDVRRFASMLDGTTVAIVGTRWASDYGMETARHFARGLAASGLTVLSGLAEGIPVAAHSGALEAGRATLAVISGGLERCSPASCETLYRRIVAHGCAIAETSWSSRAHRWCELACARTLALLAQLVIVVEADDRPWELACAHIARTRGKLVAAIPGRLNSPASRGTNTLLMQGARLVRSPRDALDLLYGVDCHRAPERSTAFEPRLETVLEQVGAGADTVAKLTARGADPAETASALVELELKGLLLRGDGGRYLPCAGVLAK